MTLVEAQTLHPKELSDADAARWRALCAADPACGGPLMGPDFAHVVGELRDDARVVVLRRDGESVGFLPYHARPSGFARPIGAPLSDYHGPVLAPDVEVDLGQVLADVGVAAYRFTGLAESRRSFWTGVVARREGFVIAPDAGADAYLEAVRAESPKKFKNYRRLEHKLERDLGHLTVAAPDASPTAFDQLIAWKREQLRRTGSHDFLAPDWTRRLLRILFERPGGDFRGLMIGLYAGERLVAGHFGVRLGGAYHPWIASADPELGAYSPGQIFLLRAIAAMPALGLATYDLGPGHDHYKRAYGLTRRVVGEGLIAADSAAGRAALGVEGVWAAAGAHGDGVAARLRRRLDLITSVELSFSGRALGLAQAVADQARRRPAEAA